MAKAGGESFWSWLLAPQATTWGYKTKNCEWTKKSLNINITNVLTLPFRKHLPKTHVCKTFMRNPWIQNLFNPINPFLYIYKHAHIHCYA